MAVNPATAGNAHVSTLANQLFKTVDANSDGKLSGNEFQSFLESLLQKLETRTSSGASAPVSIRETKSYAPMEGFDSAKLNNPLHATPKYVFARATQDIEIGTDRASRSASLERIAAYARERGYPNSVVNGDDKIDFGDGHGAVDVLTAGGQWWWEHS